MQTTVWLLTITLFVDQYPQVVDQHEFDSLEECVAASRDVVREYHQNAKSQGYMSASCRPVDQKAKPQ